MPSPSPVSHTAGGPTRAPGHAGGRRRLPRSAGEDPLPVAASPIGPNVHKVGRHLRYRWLEVDEWLAAQSAYDLTA